MKYSTPILEARGDVRIATMANINSDESDSSSSKAHVVTSQNRADTASASETSGEVQ